MFLHASRRELDDPDQARLPDRVYADLLFELPASQGASLGEWLGCAAVVAEVEADGVIVSAHANRVFRIADLAGLVREWMKAHSVEAVLASSDEALFALPNSRTAWPMPRASSGSFLAPKRSRITKKMISVSGPKKLPKDAIFMMALR